MATCFSGGFPTSMVVMRYRTTGIYEWGHGYVSAEAANGWRLYFEKFSDFKWCKIPPRSCGDCWRLVDSYSMIYLHPMSGLVHLQDSKQAGELQRILSEAAAAAGGTCQFAMQTVNYTLKI